MNAPKTKKDHWAIFIDNSSDKAHFINSLLYGNPSSILSHLKGRKGHLFSKLALEKYMIEEDRHDIQIINTRTGQTLRSMSSGEQKKALLRHLLQKKADFILLDNPFDNLDADSQKELKVLLEKMARDTILIQLISRKKDLLPFIPNHASLEKRSLTVHESLEKPTNLSPRETIAFTKEIPPPLYQIPYESQILVKLKNVNVSYSGKRVLNAIDWTIRKGDFWQLTGKNGSGKTTLLSMITGENPKGYGQELFIFGHKKGSGESIWELREKMGYFSPAMTDKFTGYHTLEHMIISGLTDSIGLYTKPTEAQLRLAREWLKFLGLYNLRHTHFHELTTGQQRLIMTVRAMVKHPLLLVLDEPTVGLDDTSAAILVHLVNKMAKESDTTILFVSHRNEPNLKPKKILELQMTKEGSIGKITIP